MRKRTLEVISAAAITACLLSGCAGQSANKTASAGGGTTQQKTTTSSAAAQTNQPVTIVLAAASSLKNTFDQTLIPMFKAKYPYIDVSCTYDSSGKLQTQIEGGLPADVFMSAADAQMNALKDKGLLTAGSVSEVLENKIVLIVPAGKDSGISSFNDIVKAKTVALGDPASVPAGQYAKEALTNLGLWDKVQKASFGTNVTEVLSWVSAGSADAGIVYATDAKSTDKVKVVAEAPKGSLKTKVTYPIGMIAASKNQEAAKLLIDFIKSDDAMKVFEKAGFSKAG